jgi:glycosyltransferase involved in cell wall biosynthesis
VNKGDVDGWIEKLSLLINDNSQAVTMGTEGRKFVEENFSWEIIANRFIDFLNKNKIM